MKRILFLITLFVLVPAARGEEFGEYIERLNPKPGVRFRWLCHCSAEEYAEALAAYRPPENFMPDLRRAWRTAGVNDYDFWGFTLWLREHLPFSDDDLQFFLAAAKEPKDTHRRDTARSCLAATKRLEFLPVFREMLKDDDPQQVRRGIDLLGVYGDRLPEEDIDRIIAGLSETRTTGVILPAAMGSEYVVYNALCALGDLGPRAERAYDVILRELVDCSNYDAAKFAAFLEKIQKPGLTPDAFWQMTADAGLRLSRRYSSDEFAVASLARFWKFGPDEGEPPEDLDVATCLAAMWAMTGMSGFEVPTYYEFHFPSWHDEIKNDFQRADVLGLTLLKLRPDDPRGLFLLLQATLIKYETLDADKPLRLVDNWWNLSESRALLPLIDLMIRNPEMLESYMERCQYSSWLNEEPGEELARIRHEAVLDMLGTALECDLTEAECLRYAGMYLDMNLEDFYGNPITDPASSLTRYQQKHCGTLVAMMKARMAAATKGSWAYECAEEYLRDVGELGQ